MRTPPTNQGFTLIELMVAIVVLAIGIMATIALQYTALAGYTSSRETTGAVEVARSIEQRLKTEALSWQTGSSPASTTAFTGETSLLAAMGSGSWTMVNQGGEPISLRMNDGGPQRFCAFVIGEQMEELIGEIDGDDVFEPRPYMQVTIAVVFPAANAQFPGVSDTSPWGSCNGLGPLTPGDRTELEKDGLRVVFLSTAVRPLQ